MKIRIRDRREASDEAWVKTEAENIGVESIKVGHSGWPDRLYLIPGGRPFWIEHKRAGHLGMARQLWRIKRLHDLGYDAEIIDDRHEALRAIREKMEAAQVPRQRRNAAGGKCSPVPVRKPRSR